MSCGIVSNMPEPVKSVALVCAVLVVGLEDVVSRFRECSGATVLLHDARRIVVMNAWMTGAAVMVLGLLVFTCLLFTNLGSVRAGATVFSSTYPARIWFGHLQR